MPITLPIQLVAHWLFNMAETREFNADGALKKLTINNSDRKLSLQLENITRQIPVEVASIVYQELDNLGIVTKSITKTRAQLLNMTDNYSFVFDLTYYPTGEIDIIRIRTFNASATKLKDKSLKHYLDGRKPVYL